MQTLYLTGVQYSHSQLLKLYLIYSYYKILPIFPVIQYIFIAYFILNSCTSYSSTPILSLPPSLPPSVSVFHLCFTH